MNRTKLFSMMPMEYKQDEFKAGKKVVGFNPASYLLNSDTMQMEDIYRVSYDILLNKYNQNIDYIYANYSTLIGKERLDSLVLPMGRDNGRLYYF